MSKLFIVPTPVGNLEDITLRALRVLKEVNLILAEDTRQTKKLLDHFQIQNQLPPTINLTSENLANKLYKNYNRA